MYNVGTGGSVTQQKQSASISSPNWVLAVLAFINLFSYLDRYVVSGVLESLKNAGLGLSDTNLGSLMSGFLVVYTLLAPVFGALGDRRSRPRLIAIGVACWSFATALSGFAVNFLTLFAARAAVGVGEAAYVTIAPSLLSDYFPDSPARPRDGDFLLCDPGGLGLGLRGRRIGRQELRLARGIFCRRRPGPRVGGAVPVFARSAARRSGWRGRRCARAAAPPATRSSISRETWLTYGRLLRNKPYALTVLGYAAYTFAVGGLAYWMPAFLERVRGISRSEATVSFGTIVVVTGFVGTFIGGWMGDYFARRSRQAHLYLSAVATLIAAPFVWMALTTSSHSLYQFYMVTAQLCLFLSTGPINAAIVNLVIASERATAIALSVFAIHLLGDALSPFMVGALSDRVLPGQAVRILPVAVLIGGFVWIWAARAQGRAGRTSSSEQAQIRRSGGPAE